MVIARSGGLDGVALQAREYRYLLNSVGITVRMVTGRAETQYSAPDPIGQKEITLPNLSLYHHVSRLVYANQFRVGSEKEGIDEIGREKWFELFHAQKEAIKSGLSRVLRSAPPSSPVFVFNLLALRHRHPAAAAAVVQLLDECPDRGFISHAADPDAERPEKIERLKDFVLPVISASSKDQPYSGGPIHRNNLYHIVLNPTQKENFIEKYGVAADHVFEIPDFIEFKFDQPAIRRAPSLVFLDYLSDCCLRSRGESYGYKRQIVNRGTTFFLSPVRPVARKRLRESMLLAQQYGKSRRRRIAFVVTHPNKDDVDYFMACLRFADGLRLPYYHLGQSFSFETLENVYENFAALATVGVVASSAGGWENALNEMARYAIPFYMNRNLNSFRPLTKTIGMRTHGTDFSQFSDLVEERSPADLRREDLTSHPEVAAAFRWIDEALAPDKRRRLIRHNYRRALAYLSHEATAPRLMKVLEYIRERHGQVSR